MHSLSPELHGSQSPIWWFKPIINCAAPFLEKRHFPFIFWILNLSLLLITAIAISESTKNILVQRKFGKVPVSKEKVGVALCVSLNQKVLSESFTLR